jgi:catechol 2,3-dioxygenase-like lactoylglutathione lyase family enzyme
MKVMPIRYVSDVERFTEFFRALGLGVQARSRPGDWQELTATGGVLALHTAGAGSSTPDVELCLLTEEDLGVVAKRLDDAGYPHSGVLDENFGRKLRVKDPDGVIVQVNEHDPSLYT